MSFLNRDDTRRPRRRAVRPRGLGQVVVTQSPSGAQTPVFAWWTYTPQVVQTTVQSQTTVPAPSPTPSVIASTNPDIARASALGNELVREWLVNDAMDSRRKADLLTQISSLFKSWATVDDKASILKIAQGDGTPLESDYLANVLNANLYAYARVAIMRGLSSPGGLEFVRRGNPSAAQSSTSESYNNGISEAVNEEQGRQALVQRIFGVYKSELDKLPTMIAGGSPTRPVVHPDYDKAWNAFHDPIKAYYAPGRSASSVLTGITYPPRDRITEMFRRRAQAVYDAAAPLRQVLDEIPWPHDFFRSFVSYPLSNPGLFYQQAPIWYWEDLWTAGYFTRTRDEIARDVATWLKTNGDALQAHFIAEAEAWMKKEEDKAKKAGQILAVGGWVLQIFGYALSALLPGIGSVVSSVMSGAYKYWTTSQMGAEQKKMFQKVLSVMKIDESKMQAFSDWLARWASIAQPQFIVKIEGREVGRFATAEEAARAITAGSSVGQRIEIFWGDQSLGLKLRTATGIVDVPAENEAQIRSMSAADLTARVAQTAQPVVTPGTQGALPWWLVPLGMILFG